MFAQKKLPYLLVILMIFRLIFPVINSATLFVPAKACEQQSLDSADLDANAIIPDAENDVITNETTEENLLSSDSSQETAEKTKLDNNDSNVQEAEIENVLEANLFTGSSSADLDEAVIETGDATLSAQLVNLANIFAVGDDLRPIIINLSDDNTENIDLNQDQKNNEKLDFINLPTNTSESLDKINGLNWVKIGNHIYLQVSTGDNIASGQASLVKTGNIYILADLINIANFNLIGKNSLFSIVNLLADQSGDVLLPYEFDYLDDFSAQSLPKQTSIISSNINQALISNSVNLSSNTGENKVLDEGEIYGGQSTSSINILDIANTNISGDNWLFLQINNFGNWSGDLIGWWGEYYKTPFFTYAWAKLGYDDNSNLNINNFSYASIQNFINISTNTGRNNIESGMISTGDIKINVNIFDLINSNITGKNWYFSTINIFHNLAGNIVFPRPDLKVNIEASKKEALAGEEITYYIHYKNQGNLAAKKTRLLSSFSEGTIFMSSSGQFENNQVWWDLGEVAPGQEGVLTISVKIDPHISLPSITSNASITSQTFEIDKSNNTAAATVTVILPKKEENLLEKKESEEIKENFLTEINTTTSDYEEAIINKQNNEVLAKKTVYPKKAEKKKDQELLSFIPLFFFVVLLPLAYLLKRKDKSTD